MPLAQPLVEHLARHFREPVVETSEKAEDDGADQNVVEVGNDEIGVVQLPVKGRNRKHDSGQACEQELSQKGSAEKHRRGKTYFASPQVAVPFKTLYAGG